MTDVSPSFVPGLESVKWLALLAMTIDHVNTIVLSGSEAWMHAIGRTALPLFCLAFGFGISRRLNWQALLPRLLAFASLGQIAWVLAGNGLTPNILFTLALCVCAIKLYPRFPIATVLVGLVLGFFPEGTYGAIGLVVGSYLLANGRSTTGWLFLLFGTLLACWLNTSLWPAASIPVFFLLMQINVGPTRRAPQFLYWYYPVHVLALAVAAYTIAG